MNKKITKKVTMKFVVEVPEEMTKLEIANRLASKFGFANYKVTS